MFFCTIKVQCCLDFQNFNKQTFPVIYLFKLCFTKEAFLKISDVVFNFSYKERPMLISWLSKIEKFNFKHWPNSYFILEHNKWQMFQSIFFWYNENQQVSVLFLDPIDNVFLYCKSMSSSKMTPFRHQNEISEWIWRRKNITYHQNKQWINRKTNRDEQRLNCAHQGAVWAVKASV